MAEANNYEIESQIEMDTQNENEPEVTPETYNNSFEEPDPKRQRNEEKEKIIEKTQTTLNFGSKKPTDKDKPASGTEKQKTKLTTNEKIAKLISRIDALENVTERLVKENELLKNEVKSLKDDKDDLKHQQSDLERKVDGVKENTDYAIYRSNVAMEKGEDLEQHGRANSVRLYGIKDTRDEDAAGTINLVIDLLKNRLELDIDKSAIDVAHRLGPYNSTTKRGIICKFVRRVDTTRVIKNRKKLKNTKITIVEDLTNENRNLLMKYREAHGIKNAWSSHGNIWTEDNNGRIMKREREIKSFIRNFEEKLYNQMLEDPRSPPRSPPRSNAWSTQGKKKNTTGRNGNQSNNNWRR